MGESGHTGIGKSARGLDAMGGPVAVGAIANEKRERCQYRLLVMDSRYIKPQTVVAG